MGFETLAAMAIVALAAVIGGLAGGWAGSRRRSDPALMQGFQELSTLVDHSAKATRECVESLRQALSDTERAFGAKLDDGLRLGFDRSLAAIGEGARAQATEIEAFRTQVGAVREAMIKLGTDVPAALGNARADARLDAADASKLLLEQLPTGLRQHDQALATFQAALTEAT